MRPIETGCVHPGILDGVPGFFRFKAAWGTRLPNGFPPSPKEGFVCAGFAGPLASCGDSLGQLV